MHEEFSIQLSRQKLLHCKQQSCTEMTNPLKLKTKGAKALKTTITTEQSICRASRCFRGSKLDSAKQQHKLESVLLLINQGH